MEKTDEDLIKEYLEENQDSFKVLLDRYTSSIYNFSIRFVGRENASDVTQDVFIKVWKNIKKFDIEKAHFKTWLFIIARNTITDYLRKKKMVLFSSLDYDGELFEDSIKDEALLPDEILSKLEDNEYLNKALDQMPSKYKEVLVLHYQEDMTFAEIGKVLNKPTNTVKSYHHRALVLLREMI